jgi:type IV pilus assembly protein PilM
MGFANIFSSLKKGKGAGAPAPVQRNANVASPKAPKVADSPIAVDFGTGALKLLQVVNSNPPQLISAACLVTPPELIGEHNKRLDLQFEALPKLVKAAGFRGKRAVCAIPSWQVMVKHMQFPKVEQAALGEMIKSVIPQQFNADPSMLVYRYNELPPEKGSTKSDAIVIATRRESVQRLMGAVMGSKLEPVGMHTPFLCQLRAFDHLHRREGDGDANTVYVDLGALTTTVAISNGVELVFARVIQLGGWHMDDLISRKLGTGIAEARRIRLASDDPQTEQAQTPGSSPPAQDGIDRREQQRPAGFSEEIDQTQRLPIGPANADLSETVEMLTDELKLCLRYYCSQFPSKRLARVIFLGGETKHRGLVQHLARAVRLPAHTADPLARVARTGKETVIGVDFKVPQPGWSVALGACLAPTDL